MPPEYNFSDDYYVSDTIITNMNYRNDSFIVLGVLKKAFRKERGYSRPKWKMMIYRKVQFVLAQIM